MLNRQTYYKNGDGFILNQHYKDGDDVSLYPKQAKYLLPPLGGELRREKKKPAASSQKTAPRAESAK